MDVEVRLSRPFSALNYRFASRGKASPATLLVRSEGDAMLCSASLRVTHAAFDAKQPWDLGDYLIIAATDRQRSDL
jgi:hypothetical protein